MTAPRTGYGLAAVPAAGAGPRRPVATSRPARGASDPGSSAKPGAPPARATLAALALAAAGLALLAAAPGARAQPTATANFHTIGLYWTRPPAAGGVAVQYKPAGAAAWKGAQPLWYDGASPNAAYRNQYRGSVVNLAPGATYNLRYRVGAGAWTPMPNAATRPDAVPSSGNTIPYGGRTLTGTLVITQGGTAGNWRIYDGQGTAVIDPGHLADCVAVRASHVVLRGFAIRNCRGSAVVVEKPNVVIERNTISDWGLQELHHQTAARDGHYLNEPTATCVAGVLKTDFGRVDDAGVRVLPAANDGIVIQRNTIRDPRYRSTRWNECPAPGYVDHPWGPRAIALPASAGNVGRGNVIRYNDIRAANTKGGGAQLSDDANRYYDAVWVPYQQDLDLYGNIVRNAVDDLIEADNAAINVRIWGNYFDHALTWVSHQKMEAGPSYVFRNVFDRAADAGPGNPGTWDVLIPNGTRQPVDSAGVLKLRQDNGVGGAVFTGPAYVFHNTSLRAGEDGMAHAHSLGRADQAAKVPNDLPNVVSKNNVWLTARSYLHDVLPRDFVRYHFGDMRNRGNDTDVAYALAPEDFLAQAAWRGGHGPGAPWSAPAVPTGRYQVANAGAGVPIANFNDPARQGRGAHAYDPGSDEPMRFGPGADWTYRP